MSRDKCIFNGKVTEVKPFMKYMISPVVYYHEYKDNKKKCKTCGEIKDIKEFYKLYQNRVGPNNKVERVLYRQSNCIRCTINNKQKHKKD